MIWSNIGLHERIVAKIKEHEPNKGEISRILAHVLGIPKISAYRRLTGQVKFSLEEVAIISSYFNFSVDALIEQQSSEKALFEIQHIDDQRADFCDLKVDQFVQMIENLANCSGAVYSIASNTIPFLLCARYDMIYKATLYKWLYAIKLINPNTTFSNFILPDTLVEKRSSYIKLQEKCPKVVFIVDEFLFSAVLSEIGYLYKGKLISKEEILILSKELNTLLSDLETAANKGILYQQIPFEIYVSEQKIDSSYSYIEYEGMYTAFFSGYSINIFKSLDPDICKIQKGWMDSLQRYSYCISQSSELYRLEYFNNQRDILKKGIQSILIDSQII